MTIELKEKKKKRQLYDSSTICH